MKLINWLRPLIVTTLMFGLVACEDSMDDDDDMNISMHNELESHNAGQICQDCHQPGGGGEGNFSVAGSVYHENNLTQLYPNTTVHIYTEPNGQGMLVMSIEVDGIGNFYTTQDISWGAGLYAAVSSAMGTHYMDGAINRGDCNDCHDGIGEMRIFAN